MYFNAFKGEILESKTWEDEYIKNNVRHMIPRQRILVLTETVGESFFEGKLIDAIDFAPGQKIIIGEGTASEKNNDGQIIYVENVNTGVYKSSGFPKPMGPFGLTMLWIIYNILLLGAEFSIEMELTNSGRSQMPTIGSYIFFGQWGYIGLILFWQMVKWSRQNTYWTKRKFKPLVIEAGEKIGVVFDPESFSEKTGYALVRL